MKFDYDSDFCLESDQEVKPQIPAPLFVKRKRGRPPVYQHFNQPMKAKRPLLSQVNYDFYKRKKGSRTYNQPSNASLRMPPTLPLVFNEKQIHNTHHSLVQSSNKLINISEQDNVKQVDLDDEYLQAIDLQIGSSGQLAVDKLKANDSFSTREQIKECSMVDKKGCSKMIEEQNNKDNKDGNYYADGDLALTNTLYLELTSRFKRVPIKLLISTLYHQIVIQKRTEQNYLQRYTQLTIDREIINMYLSDKKVSTACKILAQINDQHNNGAKAKGVSVDQHNNGAKAQGVSVDLQVLRDRLYMILKQAMEKYNNQPREWLLSGVLSEQQMDRVISGQDGLECRVLLARYWQISQPRQKDRDELRRKLQMYLNRKCSANNEL